MYTRVLDKLTRSMFRFWFHIRLKTYQQGWPKTTTFYCVTIPSAFPTFTKNVYWLLNPSSRCCLPRPFACFILDIRIVIFVIFSVKTKLNNTPNAIRPSKFRANRSVCFINDCIYQKINKIAERLCIKFVFRSWKKANIRVTPRPS